MADKKNYIDNDELEQEMSKYRLTHQVSERLGQILIDLHDHILQHQNFRGYRQDIKDEMRSYSLLRLLKRGLDTYNPDKGCKAFSYFTRAVFQNFLTVLQRYYRTLNQHQQYVKDMLMRVDNNCEAWKKFVRDFNLSENGDVINYRMEDIL